MNPEFQRNLWLELTRRRVMQMLVVLALLFLAADLAEGTAGAAAAAQYVFYALVVLWGTRDAAQCVVGEIRDRTWDFQRLSALTPFEMTWGKLLGATSYVWLGGLISLAVIVLTDLLAGRIAGALLDIGYYLSIGLMAQGTALFASLLAVRRRQSHTRFNVFQYQGAGILAAWCVWWVWLTASPTASDLLRVDTVPWWGMVIAARPFYLGSLLVFLAWVLVGCYRLMRLELQIQNRPVVWAGFIVFMALYAGGFERVPFEEGARLMDVLSIRLALAAVTLSLLTYLAVLLEPKDRVLYRWLGEMLAKRRTIDVLSRLQCWMIAAAAALAVGLPLVLRLVTVPDFSGLAAMLAPMALASLGFMLRDVGIFMFFAVTPGQRRGDLPALVALGILYFIAPRLLGGFGIGSPELLLFPQREGGWLSPAIAWAEAAALWSVVFATARRPGAISPAATVS